MQNTLIVIDTTIKQDSFGRFCINDIHKASGNNPKHKPSNWLRLQATQELIEVIASSHIRELEQYQPVSVINGGDSVGTYVCKELVYSYAMWISATFNLKVIQAYDKLISKKQDIISPEMQIAHAMLLAGKMIEDQKTLIELQKQQLVEQKPKVDFYDTVTQSETELDFASVAKIISVKGLGRNNLISFLKEQKVLQLNGSPYQRFVDMGLFRLVEVPYKIHNKQFVSVKTVVLQKGVEYINKLVKEI